MKSILFYSALGPALLLSAVLSSVTISPQDAQEMGLRIWKNECKGSFDGLTSWNQGEEFASLGIGHFIWYPEGPKGPFMELFPSLLKYLDSQGAPPPGWLKECKCCPWISREEFVKDFQTERMIELRNYLKSTASLQAVFMAQRLERALPRILSGLPQSEREALSEQFYRVANSPLGTYALVDYVNFKGEGIAPQEKYNGQGWGLLQVLQTMQTMPKEMPALKAFAESAKVVLKRRVDQAPPSRNEHRWLKGWFNRVDTYSS